MKNNEKLKTSVYFSPKTPTSSCHGVMLCFGIYGNWKTRAMVLVQKENSRQKDLDEINPGRKVGRLARGEAWLVRMGSLFKVGVQEKRAGFGQSS